MDNLTYLRNFTLILSEKLLKKYDAIFHKGWTGNQITKIKHTDTKKEKETKLRKIKKFIKNPIELPEILRDPTGLMLHEVLFDKNISIDKYLIGIVCNHCDKSKIKIKEIKRYTNVPIYENNLIPKF